VGNCARCGTAMEPEVCGPTSWPTTPFKPFRSGLQHDPKNLVDNPGCDWIPHLQKTSKETSPRRSADSHPNRSKERQSPIWLHSNDARKQRQSLDSRPVFSPLVNFKPVSVGDTPCSKVCRDSVFRDLVIGTTGETRGNSLLTDGLGNPRGTAFLKVFRPGTHFVSMLIMM